MKVKMILPALTEARSPYFRPIKYSLFPPLGLATLAGYLEPDDEIELWDEHVQDVPLDDRPELVVIEAYVTSARRAYALADHHRRRGAHVCLGGLHPTALPDEARAHADTVFCGPGEDTWPAFLRDFRAGRPGACYQSTARSLVDAPPPRRDLLASTRYLVPSSIVVSRGCPHHCAFCYKDSFYRGGRSFYTQRVDAALAEIARLPGRHLFFLDDNLFADRRFALALFAGMRGMGRVWQAAATVGGVLDRELLDAARASGLRSLFVGFETLRAPGLLAARKGHNLVGSYQAVTDALHERGIMVNGSFVFGMAEDDESVFDRTVDWAIARGIETATFHILTPYPGTDLHRQLRAMGRLLHEDWDRYDTRHAVFRPERMTPAALERGYWHAYRRFYQLDNIARAAASKPGALAMLRHLAYTIGWKKLEPFWAFVIHSGLLGTMRPVLETLLELDPRQRRAVSASQAWANAEGPREPASPALRLASMEPSLTALGERGSVGRRAPLGAAA